MKIIPNLDIHITHRCNFTCESCSHFMNHGFNDHISIDDCKSWILNWNKRILPKNIGILGGEPFLNNNLKEYCILIREMWPTKDTEIELVTNASVIHLHPNIFETLIKYNILLSISFHHNDPNYLKIIKKKINIIKNWKNQGLNIKTYNSYDMWSKVYQGYGDSIMPFEDNDFRSSWKNCPTGQNCFQLHEGKIWKCAPLAYLPLMKKKFNISKKWDPYLEYAPLSPNCSDQELEDFFNKGAESFCSMCPAKYRKFKKSSPLLRKK